MSARFRAAIFDLDGTLVDNMGYHARAWVEVARELGGELPFERVVRDLAGLKNEELLPLLVGRPMEAEEIARCAAAKEEAYRRLYAPHLAPTAGAIAWLGALAGAGVRLGVATAATAASRALVLDGLGIAARFQAVIGHEHAPRGKPFPDLFLAAAAALEVEPADCVAFEDADNGIRAARAAGMAAVGITTSAPAEVLAAAGAHWILSDFSRPPEDLRARLLGPD